MTLAECFMAGFREPFAKLAAQRKLSAEYDALKLDIQAINRLFDRGYKLDGEAICEHMRNFYNAKTVDKDTHD